MPCYPTTVHNIVICQIEFNFPVSCHRKDTRKSATSPTNQRGCHGFVTGLSRTCRRNGIWA